MFAVATIFVSVALGSTARACLTRHLPTVDLVGDPRVALHQLVDECDVAPLRALDLRLHAVSSASSPMIAGGITKSATDSST
jgi:hypothetical protein